MGRVAIVTDSNVCLPEELVRRYDIHIVPLSLQFDRRSLRDGLDISPAEFYRLLPAAKAPPTTSAPSPGDFLQAYAGLGDRVEGIVCILISGELSATYEAGLAAACLADWPPIRVIDSRTATMAQGFIVLEAARAAAEGRGGAPV